MLDSSSLTISEQENAPVLNTNPSTDSNNQQNINKNTIKRVRFNGSDDSFEREHRLVNGPIQYFNRGDSRTTTNDIVSPAKPKETISTPRRPNFPPFRLNFVGDDKPSELSIIKSFNKHFRTNITYGRYSISNKKSFLIYANSGDQFDRFMDRAAWPVLLCEKDYSIDLPSKVPSSYSIVLLGVPTQWNLDNFATDIKKQYKTIIKVDRLYVRGGVPISKVRIDFSSNEEITQILRNKRMILDDENTSFMVQPYSPPIKIPRCFNCQMYSDHIASNCPQKDNPTCFRCAKNHPFDPKCSNKICCANCQQDHLAGNPNCPIKIEARKKQLASTSSQTTTKPKPNQIPKLVNNLIPPTSAWLNNNRNTIDSPDFLYSQSNVMSCNIGPPDLLAIDKKLDLLMNKIDVLVTEQTTTNSNINILNQQINRCHSNVDSIKQFILNSLCPYVAQLSESFLGKTNQQRKEKLHVSYTQFKQNLQSFETNLSIDSYQPNMLQSSSPNESNS